MTGSLHTSYGRLDLAHVPQSDALAGCDLPALSTTVMACFVRCPPDGLLGPGGPGVE
ncbi:hypothetical protein GSF22_30095, partial [Micromonospora echinofusca]|nr:hypothetical protein [Micromonospora echinofusca]